MFSRLWFFSVSVFFVFIVFLFAWITQGIRQVIPDIAGAPLFFLFVYFWGEVSLFLTRAQRKDFFWEDYIKSGLLFGCAGLFIGGCIQLADLVIGEKVGYVVFAVILYFIFRFARLIDHHERKVPMWNI